MVKRDEDAPEEVTVAKELHTEELSEMVHNTDILLTLVQPEKGI